QTVLTEAYGTAQTQNQINSLKTFFINRFNYIRPRIPTVFQVDHAYPLVNGYPQTPSANISISGLTPLADTGSITVNGQRVTYGGNATWTSVFPGQLTDDLIPALSTWKYLDNRVDQGTAWRAQGFDDSTWTEGGGILGAGDAGPNTTLALGPAGDRTPTFYFRHEFNVVDPTAIARLNVDLIRDDGAVVYLNGIEQFRDNMPAGVVSYGSLASDFVSFPNEQAYFPFAINPLDLVVGANVLAVEVHQNAPDSSDVHFDLRLEATSGGDSQLAPGLNRIYVEVFDELNGRGNTLYTDQLDVWYDGRTVAVPASTLVADETWSPADGTYVVAGDVVVPTGVTLTIDPATTLFFAENATLTIDGGKLIAAGSPYQEIRFMQNPAAAGSWDGLVFTDTQEDNLLSYVIVQDVHDASEVVRVIDSSLTVDNVKFEQSDTRRIYAETSSLVVTDSIFSTIAGADSAHADTQIVAVGTSVGQWLVEGNQFAAADGENDVIQILGPLAGGDTIPVIRGNEFLGGQQAGVGAQESAVVVDGNRFSNFVAGGINPERAGGVYINGDVSATLTRNVFDGSTRAVTVINSASVEFENNTVHDITSPTLQFSVSGEGMGEAIAVESSIFWNVTEVLDADGQARATIDNSIVPTAYLAFGSANLDVDPLFTNAGAGDFSLSRLSPAIGNGENGLDRGGVVSNGASLSGEPPVLTHLTDATLLVAGPGIEQYSYRVNDGIWSGPHDVSTPITVSGLADGEYRVEVVGDDQFGMSQQVATFSQQWTVESGLERLLISEVLAANGTAVDVNGLYPDVIELYNAGGTTINLVGYTLSDNSTNPTKFVFPTTILGVGEYLLVYADTNVGSGLETGFSLAGTGEGVFLYNAAAQLLDSVEFGIQVTNLSIARLGRDEGWSLAAPSLGATNVPVVLGTGDQLMINEWFASGDVRRIDDFVELRNGEPYPVDLSGYYLTDDFAVERTKHQIAPLSYIGAGGYLEFEADRDVSAGADHLNFNLSSDQELISLFDANLELLDQVYFFPQATDYSQGRDPDGSDNYSYFRLPTPDLANVPPTVNEQPDYDRANALLDSLRITEIMYNPQALGDLEYLEFRNIGDQPLDISGVRIDGGVTFTFPARVLQPGEYVVVAQDATQFASHYGDWISLAGTYTGSLSNSG
ncbi:MAG: hypothetical protein ACI9HK_006004, partial [Pirellulaceae bacterium]